MPSASLEALRRYFGVLAEKQAASFDASRAFLFRVRGVLNSARNRSQFSNLPGAPRHFVDASRPTQLSLVLAFQLPFPLDASTPPTI